MLGFKNRKEKLLDYQRELLEQHYAEIENMYTKMRSWRHDYHNHIQVLFTCLENGETDEAMRYLAEIQENLVSVDTALKTGNTMVDAILGSKIALMNAKNIPVKATAKVPSKLAVSDIDLCIIIGNLLDNAIEESRKLPKEDRFIRVYLGQKNTQLYLIFTNAAGKKQSKHGRLFFSSKNSEHGFGLSRVESVVTKYGGQFFADSEDGGFTAEILIPLETDHK